MSTFSIRACLLAFLALVGVARAANNHPAILVHGLFGDGDRSKSINWGDADQDIQEDLRANGYEVFTADMGPISSNWDRACELYAQIMGGQVDYGEAHSARFGHNRFGRIYPALVDTPNFDWGVGGDKLHLIGHSMGGQTIRVLSALLENGDASERARSGASVSPLFKGDKTASAYIASLTTLNAPHDGSTLVNVINNFGLLDIVIGFAVDRDDFDFQWGHWGITREAGESNDSYTDRIKRSPALDTIDYAAYDVAYDNAAVLNQLAPAIPDIYHFTYSTSGTAKEWFGSNHNPRFGSMTAALWVPAWLMGNFDGAGKSYYENDGVVPLKSQIGPHVGSNDKIVEYNGSSVQMGVWNHMETGRGDHGFRQKKGKTSDNVLPFWRENLMPLLTSLDVGSDKTSIAVSPAKWAEVPDNGLDFGSDEAICDGDLVGCSRYVQLIQEKYLEAAAAAEAEQSNQARASDNQAASIAAGAGAFAAGIVVCAGLMIAMNKRQSAPKTKALEDDAAWFRNSLAVDAKV